MSLLSLLCSSFALPLGVVFNTSIRYLFSSCWDKGVIFFLCCWVNWTIVAFLASFCVPANFTFLALKSPWGSFLSYLLKPNLLLCTWSTWPCGWIGVASGRRWLCCARSTTLALMRGEKACDTDTENWYCSCFWVAVLQWCTLRYCGLVCLRLRGCWGLLSHRRIQWRGWCGSTKA